MNNNEYIRLSLELHLFFDRIMKEHSLFIEAAFMEKDKELKPIARDFQETFSNFLGESIRLANGNISNDFLMSEEIVTKNTLEAENKTSMLSGAPINTNLTLNELNLRSGNVSATENLLNSISNLNKETLPVIENLIYFKNDILDSVLSCQMYTTNYPLLIQHIQNEAKMYYNLLARVEQRMAFTQNYIYEQELFWNEIMKEHAEFIRGLLDPTEEELIMTADKYANEYKMILQNYGNNPSYLASTSLTETINFRDFKIAGEEGILNCKIRSIIIPLLADHVVREANHFIRILKSANKY
ncbi:MAG: DUF2935 domain-containing protein [Bacilli bacterium]|nr:DUF2935 domain-containing protein [Bacilli bacterium]